MKSQCAQVIRVHPGGDMNVYPKFYGNLSNSCRDISLRITSVYLLLALDEMSCRLHDLSFSVTTGTKFPIVHSVNL